MDGYPLTNTIICTCIVYYYNMDTQQLYLFNSMYTLFTQFNYRRCRAGRLFYRSSESASPLTRGATCNTCTWNIVFSQVNTYIYIIWVRRTRPSLIYTLYYYIMRHQGMRNRYIYNVIYVHVSHTQALAREPVSAR